MSFFLVFVAIVLAAVAILVGTDLVPRIFRRRAGEQPFNDGFDEPVASLPAVLLPADAEPADVDRIRFAVGLRGYRMDQVDQVLDELRDQIARKDREIARLRTEREATTPERSPLEHPLPEGAPERHPDTAPDPAP
ncbi:DivIVA domain-containing protein [Arthrobacter sp. C9C5]|uniref:DivIVA domain-containing protein n=1 Tax=Arthrobacter sp. C9C5 TaxID=2735267 RepID=UPI001584DA88|nr:DivIVA domain-containing protein [Arthrobacter sp. C9C5]